MSEYEIGGVCVKMTREQADRWNSGGTSELDMLEIEVVIPTRRGCSSSVIDGEVVVKDGMPTTKHMALCEALGDAELSEMMDGMSAKLVRA